MKKIMEKTFRSGGLVLALIIGFVVTLLVGLSTAPVEAVHLTCGQTVSGHVADRISLS